MLLSQAFDRYLSEVVNFTNQSNKTAEHCELSKKMIIRVLGDLEVCKIDIPHIVKFKKYMDDKGRSPNTTRSYIIYLRCVLRHLHRNGIDCINYELISIPKRVETAPKIATQEQIDRMILATNLLRNKALIATLYASGARVSEVCRLDIDDLRGDKFTVYGKGGKYRLCFLDAVAQGFLCQYLAERQDNNPALFLNKDGGRIAVGQVQEIFRYVRKAAGIRENITPHRMRHAYATNLLRHGCHLYTLSRLMGHKSVQTTAMYLSVENPELEEAYKKYFGA